MMRGLIARVCRDYFSDVCLEEASDSHQGLLLCRRLQPDLVLLDLDLPDGDGLDRVGEIHREAPAAKIIVVTSHSDEYAIYRSLEKGVAAFVDKCAQPIEAVGEAIAAVAAGRTFFSPVVGRAKSRLRGDPQGLFTSCSPNGSRISCACWAAASPTTRWPAGWALARRRSIPTAAISWPSWASTARPS